MTMQREGIKLTRSHQQVVLSILATTAASGIVWLVFHYFIHVTGEFGDAPHPLERWWLALHGAAAMGALLALGSLVRGHVMTGWRARRNRASGGLIVAAGATLIGTGWALYYVGDEAVRPALSVMHWAIGLAAVLATPLHMRWGRAASARAAANRKHERRHRIETSQYAAHPGRRHRAEDIGSTHPSHDSGMEKTRAAH